MPDEDDTVIANLKRAGAIIIGKTNLTELGITGFTHRFSIRRNPWNLIYALVDPAAAPELLQRPAFVPYL